MSSTNFGSILIFASCVVGTCNLFRRFWVNKPFHTKCATSTAARISVLHKRGAIRDGSNILQVYIYGTIWGSEYPVPSALISWAPLPPLAELSWFVLVVY